MGHVEIVRALLSRGAALCLKYSSGPSLEDSLLCLAAKSGHLPVVQELLMRRASVLQKDERNWQPLRYAAFNAHPKVVEVLLTHGATVSGGASGGWGFNVTAHRIGFANDVFKEDQRKGEVLRLLTSAEAREQQAQKYLTAATAPAVPPAVQNQNPPTALPNSNTPSPPAQTPRPPPPPPRLRTPTELGSHTPSRDAAIPSRYTYDPPPSPKMPLAPGVPAQQTQHASPPDPAQPFQQAYPIASPPLFPSPCPLNKAMRHQAIQITRQVPCPHS